MVYYKNYFNDMDKLVLAKSEVFSNFVEIMTKNDTLQKQADQAEVEKILEVLRVKIQTNAAYKQKLVELKQKIENDPNAAAGLPPDFITALNMLELNF